MKLRKGHKNEILCDMRNKWILSKKKIFCRQALKLENSLLSRKIK